MLTPEIELVLKKHQIEYFEFIQTGDHQYTLRTLYPASDQLQRDMYSVVKAPLEVRYELLKIQLTPKTDSDPVAHPTHYNAGKIEVIEFIEDQKSSFHLGNAIKYIARAGIKDTTKEIEDLEKAEWYLRRQLEILRARKEGREAYRPNQMPSPKKNGPVPATPQPPGGEKLQRIKGMWTNIKLKSGSMTDCFVPDESLETYGCKLDRVWMELRNE